MKREEKKSFGLVGTQIELTNAEMDTLVRFRKRIHDCIQSFSDKSPEYLCKDEYKMLQDVFDVLIGDYVNNTTNAFEEAFLKSET